MDFGWMTLGIIAALILSPLLIWFVSIRVPIWMCQLAESRSANPDAERIFEAAVNWARRTDYLAPKSPLPRSFTALPLALEYQANYYFMRGDYAKCRSLQEERLALLQESREDQAAAASAASTLAVDYMMQNQLDHALTLAERCVGILKTAYENSKKQEAPEIEKMQRRALAAQLASAVYGNAWILEVSQRIDAAEPLRKYALELTEAEFGHDGIEVTPHLNRMGNIYRLKGEYAEAEEPLMRCLTNRIKHQASNAMIASAKQGIGELFLSEGKLKEAEQYIEDAFKMVSAEFSQDNPGWAEHAFSLGSLRRAQKRYEEGESILTQAVDVFQKKFGPMNPMLLEGLEPLLAIYKESGQTEK
jgi:tetratricopeptide (TPR) repeat protein